MVSSQRIITLCAISAFAIVAVSAADPVVKTKLGSVKGTTARTDGAKMSYNAFRGIPYAEPPVNQLRLEAPVPKKKWSGTLDATKDGSSCIQGADPLVGSENCLFVNVYTPSSRSGLLPVLVMIHGGAFTFGSAAYTELGPDHLLDQNIVVVTLQYRLGFLGFASTGDTVIPGNNGLKDQALAMKWVKENIESFGGNSKQITLAGQSAGSASVAYHMVSPGSKGLFDRAILESGTLLNPWAYAGDIQAIVRSTASGLGIDTSSSAAILKGLKTINVLALQNVSSSVNSQYILDNNPKDGLAIAPVAEVAHAGAFFSGKGHDVISKGQFNKVPTLIGYNSLEAAYDFSTAIRIYLLQYDLTPSKLVPKSMNIGSYLTEISLGKKIKDHYFNGKSVAFSEHRLLQFLSDDQFARGIIEFASQISKATPTYLYKFSYEGGLWGYSTNRTIPGVTHSEEIGYLWRVPHEPKTQQDVVVRQRMVAMWTDFVRTGNPTPAKKSLTQNVLWPETDAKKRAFVDIGTNIVVGTKPGGADIAFWDDLYAKNAKPPLSTF